jgi:DNA-directed RNA polymerase subunit E'/Rpb7
MSDERAPRHRSGKHGHGHGHGAQAAHAAHAAQAAHTGPVLDAGCFVRSLVRDAIIVKPARLGSNVREVLLRKLRSRFEGICSRHGYILPGSIELVRVSTGRCEGANLNGDVRFEVQYQASVCNPGIGTVVAARVVNVNRIGVQAHAGVYRRDDATVASVPVLLIVITKHGTELKSEVDLEGVQIGDQVNVEILGKKLELNQREIKVIGRLVRRAPADARGAASSAAPQLGNEDAAAAAQQAAATIDERVLSLSETDDDETDDTDAAEDAEGASVGDSTDESTEGDENTDGDSSTDGDDDDEKAPGGKKKAAAPGAVEDEPASETSSDSGGEDDDPVEGDDDPLDGEDDDEDDEDDEDADETD